MNAFQFGVVTYKWDSKTRTYMMRPFNFYCFPNSKLLDKKIVQFDSSTLKFLLDNNFDFNKLFKDGINYSRLSEKDQINERMKKYLREAPEFKRFYTHLGSKSSQSLDELISKVQNFVEKVKLDVNNQHCLELEIESFALKKQLATNIHNIYKDQGIVYCEYKKGTSTFTVKKWKSNNPQQAATH